MNQNERVRNKSEYASIRNTVIVSERLKPIRIIIPIIVIAMIISIVVIYTSVQKRRTVENTEQVMNQTVEYIAHNIANETEYAKSSIKFAAKAIAQNMTSSILETPSEIIGPMVDNTPFGGIEYIRPDGMNIMNIGEPFDASDRVYYIEGIKGNTGIWNNYHPKTSQETLMNFYTPIIYQGEIAGVLTGYIAATTQISPLLEKELYGQKIYGFLVDENNMVICSTLQSPYEYELTLEHFLEELEISADMLTKIRDIIGQATEKAVSHKEADGEGRICVAKIKGTEWKVALIIPRASFSAIINKNARDSVIVILVISLILVSYASEVLISNVKRRREIAKENALLEEENRIFNEENKRAFKEISAIRDINASANMGTWRIEMVDKEAPRMYVDDTMKALLGVLGQERTPEETYNDWYNNISPQAVPSVLESVEKMKNRKFDENTYLWNHPTKGERYVRCGGTAEKIEGGYVLSGYHYDVDEVVREDLAKVVMLQDALNEKNDYYNTLGTLSGIYNSVHVIDLATDTVVEFSASENVRSIVNRKDGAEQMMREVMNTLVDDEYKAKAVEFTDLTTIADRMRNKKYTSTQLVSRYIGWFLATFITLEADADGKPVKVVFTTQGIDAEKKQEEKLIRNSQTDELTGLLNRRAYDEDIYEQKNIPEKDNFVLMSLDVNGLKVVNDTLGHAAGDELLIGASSCMKESLGKYGKIYRTGGDEFVALLFCNDEELKEILAEFDETVAGWSGNIVENMTISYGYISKAEEPNRSVRELGAIADKRMYAAKSDHYRKKGVDRRGQQDAHKVLCELYTKILKINITDDSYQIVNMDLSEQTTDKGFSDKISSWLAEFGVSGQVHPDDLEEYLAKTNIKFMQNYFAEDKTSLHVFYRRKYNDGFKLVMMEIVPASDYSETNQSLYLYVKNIDK